jgi:hypothetical protein
LTAEPFIRPYLCGMFNITTFVWVKFTNLRLRFKHLMV